MSATRRFETCVLVEQFYGKINRGQVICPLCPLFGGSVIRGYCIKCLRGGVLSAMST